VSLVEVDELLKFLILAEGLLDRHTELLLELILIEWKVIENLGAVQLVKEGENEIWESLFEVIEISLVEISGQQLHAFQLYFYVCLYSSEKGPHPLAYAWEML